VPGHRVGKRLLNGYRVLVDAGGGAGRAAGAGCRLDRWSTYATSLVVWSTELHGRIDALHALASTLPWPTPLLSVDRRLTRSTATVLSSRAFPEGVWRSANTVQLSPALTLQPASSLGTYLYMSAAVSEGSSARPSSPSHARASLDGHLRPTRPLDPKHRTPTARSHRPSARPMAKKSDYLFPSPPLLLSFPPAPQWTD